MIWIRIEVTAFIVLNFVNLFYVSCIDEGIGESEKISSSNCLYTYYEPLQTLKSLVSIVMENFFFIYSGFVSSWQTFVDRGKKINK